MNLLQDIFATANLVLCFVLLCVALYCVIGYLIHEYKIEKAGRRIVEEAQRRAAIREKAEEMQNTNIDWSAFYERLHGILQDK